MNAKELKKYLLYTTIGLFAATALIGIFVVLTGSFGQTTGKIIATTSILGLLALFSMNNILRTEDERSYIKALSIIALISNLVWCTPWLLVVWADMSLGTIAWNVIITAAIVAFNATLGANFLSFKVYTKQIQVCAYVTIAMALIIGLFLIINMLGEWKFVDSLIKNTWQFWVIAGIILVFGIVTTPILARVEAKKAEAKKPLNPEAEAELRSEIENEVRAKTEAELRAEIENEVRAKVEAEMREKLAQENATEQPEQQPEQQPELSNPESNAEPLAKQTQSDETTPTQTA